MTLKERTDEMIAIRERLLATEGDFESEVKFISSMGEGIRVYKGIEILAEELGTELKEESFPCIYDYEKELSFQYKGVTFSQLK